MMEITFLMLKEISSNEGKRDDPEHFMQCHMQGAVTLPLMV